MNNCALCGDARHSAANCQWQSYEIADVWHEGSQKFYRAVLLKELSPKDVFVEPHVDFYPEKTPRS